MADKFPPELIRHIVAHLCTHQDAHTLRAASMAGSALRGPCQERLFSSLSIVGAPKPGTVETPCLRLLRRFRQSNVLTSYVKAVDIHGHDDEWFADGFLAKLLGHLAEFGSVKRFRCTVVDFKWIKPPLEVQNAIAQLMLSPSIRVVDLEGVPQENLALGNPGLKEIRLHAALDNPNRSIFATIHSEGIASPEVLSISQSQPLIGALLAPGSGMSWECLRELTIRSDLLYNSYTIPDLAQLLTAAAPTLEILRLETELFRAPNTQIDISKLTRLRQVDILNSQSLVKMLGMGAASGMQQNSFVYSLHNLLDSVLSRHLHTITIASGLALQAGPDGQAFQGNSWDIDFEVDYDEGWASIAATITDKDRFPALKAFVVQGPGVDEGIRKHLTHLDQTGLLVVADAPHACGFQVVSVAHGPVGGHGPGPGHGHPDPHSHTHGHEPYGHSHGHDHGAHGHTHDDHGYYGHAHGGHDYYDPGHGDHGHYGHSHGPLN